MGSPNSGSIASQQPGRPQENLRVRYIRQQNTNRYLRHRYVELERKIELELVEKTRQQTINRHLNHQNAELKRKIKLLERTELGEAVSKLESLEKENTELEQQIEELGEVEQVNNELVERIEELEAVEEENNDLQTQVDELQERLDQNNYMKWSGEFQNAVLEKWEGRHSSRYREVKVMSVFWASDDLGVINEIADLHSVFHDDYHFQVECYAIPDNTPYARLNQRLLDFIGGNDSDTLLIFSYHGHGNIDPVRHNLRWAANNRPNSTCIDASPFQRLFEEAAPDALLLFDACCSAESSLAPHQGLHGSVTELISACGFQTTAPGVGENSFTHALTQVLEELSTSGNAPFSVSELFSQVLSRLRNTESRVFKTTPVHCLLTFESDRRHIMLEPLSLRAAPSSSHHDEDEYNDERIMISFSTTDEEYASRGFDAWRDWILKAPEEAVGVHFTLMSDENED